MRNSGEAAEKYISSGGRTLLFALLFASCLAVAAAQAEDLIVDGTTFVLDGAHTYASVQIRNGGTLTHSAATPGSEYSLDLTVTGTLVIDATSTIDVSARGYIGGRTIGNVTTGAASGRSGGSCGGRGFPWEGNPNQTYGDFRDPLYPGSGAAIDKVAGGIGGGVVRIHAATLLLDGSIRADGGNGPGGGGGGSGGSVYIVVDSLQGSGPISANGGKGDWECYYGCRVGGGGGGGRVALYYSTNNGFDLTRVTAAGGDNDSHDAGPGAAGTVYLKQSGHAGELRIVSPAADVGAWTPLLADDALESESVTIAGPGVMVVPDQDRPIIASDVTLQSGAVLSHLPATSTESHVLRLVVRNNLAIDAASKIDVSKRGYIVGRTLDNTTAGAASALGGGSYGGLGGGTSNYTYGDPAYPNELGSGGGPADGIGSGTGGGLVHVSARHASIDGAIRSDGADGNKPAGSGGGIVLNAGTLTGAGTISAAGGKGGTYCYYGCGYGGGGGGGRVAVYVWGANTFDPVHITATKGGEDMGEDVPGEDGTVVFPPQPFFAWAEPGSDLFHGTVQLVWEALATDPDTITAEISAVGSQQAYPLGVGVAALGSIRWNTAAVPDGVYELRAMFHNQASQVIGTATRQIVVNNSVAWHGGRITANETWAANVVHVVEGNLAVTSGATLSIAPGAVIKFAPRTGMTVEAGATLSAPAAAIFTALADDTAGGDTNLDGAQSLPRRGDWDGFLVDATGQLNLSDAVERRFMRMLHRGTLVASETWAAAFVHEVAGDVVVPNAMTLTVEPGALVKFDRLGISVQGGGRLIAEGSVGQPITFTSIRDDSFGGTAAGATTWGGAPEAGDWHGLHFAGGQGVLDHATIAYGGGSATGSWDTTAGAVSTTSGAVVSLSNSRVLDPYFDGVLAWGGADVTIVSTVIAGADRAVNADGSAVVRLTSCTIDDNRIGIWGHGGRVEIANTLISNSLEAGIDNVLSSPLTLRYSDVWSDVGTSYVNHPDQTGKNGNISADPRYKDRDRGNYRLNYVSPAIDAADGVAAPGTDIVGAPRYDDPRTPNTGIATTSGAFADMGAYEFVETAPSDINLVVTAVYGPVAAMPGDRVRVEWTITNLGTGTAVGPWRDGVALILSPESAPTIVPIGEYTQATSVRLGPGQSVTVSAEFTVPAAAVGPYYWLVTANGHGDVFEGANAADNTAHSVAPVAIDLPELVADGPARTGAFATPGDSAVWKLTPLATASVSVTLDVASTVGRAELYAGCGYVPSPLNYDARGLDVAPNRARVTIGPASCSLDYYVVARAVQGSGPYTVTARTESFSVDAVQPTRAGTAGTVTLTVIGASFPSDAQVALRDAGGRELSAQATRVVDAGRLAATVALSTAQPGLADVIVRAGDGTAQQLPGAVELVSGGTSDFWFDLVGPATMRSGREAIFELRWGNRGLVDAPMHLLDVGVPPNTQVALVPGGDSVEDRLLLFTAGREVPAAVVPPGTTGARTLYVKSSAGSQVSLDYGAVSVRSAALAGTPIDWSVIAPSVRPADASEEDWSAFWTTLVGDLGNNWGAMLGVLAEDAVRLANDALGPVNEAGDDGVLLLQAVLAEINHAVGDLGWDGALTTGAGGGGAAGGKTMGRMYSLVTWGSDYKGDGDLPGTEYNSVQVYRFLFQRAQVTHPISELHDATLTSQGLDEALQKLAGGAGPGGQEYPQKNPNDTLFFYYAGHGVKEVDGKPVTPKMRLPSEEYYEFELIYRHLSPTKAGTIVVVLDACYSGYFADWLQWNHPDEGKKWHVITSTKADETTTGWSPDLSDHGFEFSYLFFNLLMEGKSFSEAKYKLPVLIETYWGLYSQMPRTFGFVNSQWQQRDQLGASKHPAVKNVLATSGQLNCVPAPTGSPLQYPGGEGSVTVTGTSPCPPDSMRKEVEAAIVVSQDPNEKVTVGTGSGGYVAADSPIIYTVYFENDPKHGATAPVQEVLLTDALSPLLDWSSVELRALGFGAERRVLPAGRTRYSSSTTLPGDPYPVAIDVRFDSETGVLTWHIASLDPASQALPADPFAGFLPVNDDTGRGEGYVSFAVKPQSDLPIGTVIRNTATITFDPTYGVNPPLVTNEALNTIGTPPALCTGDCNSGGQVTVDELLTMVNIALGNMQVEACIAGDQNSDGAVTVDEILTAVNNALSGCQSVPPTVTPGTPTRTPTPSPTRTTPPSPSVTVPPIVTATPSPSRSATASRTPTATATVTRSATVTATRTATANATPTASATRTQTPSGTPTPTASATRTPTPSATPTETTAPPTTTPGGSTAEQAVAGGAVAVANGMSVIPSVIAAIASGFQYGGGAASLGVDGGGAAAACPQGGTATRAGNIGGTVTITLSNCRLATADGLLVLDGTVTLTGLFTLTTTVDVQATLLDASGTTTRQIASASLTGTLTPQLGGSCYVTGGTFQLTTGTLTNQIPGAGTVTVGFTNTSVGVAVANFSADCVPVNYSLTFNGPATIGITTGAGAAASSSFDVTFSNFTVSQDARNAPTQTQMNGSIASTCFGGTVMLATRAALTQMAGTACPSAGILRVTAAATTDILYLFGGMAGIDTNLDGTSEKTFPSCLDTALLTCMQAGGTPTATRTPTQTVAMSATPSPTQTRTIGSASVTPTPTRTTFPVSPTATGTVGFVTPTAQPPLTPTPTRTVSGTPATPTPTSTPGEHVYCDTLTSPLAIPDNDESGISDQITIADNVPITALRVQVQINHTWVGDLAVDLVHSDTLTLTTLMYRPGELPFGCSGHNIACTFDDTAATYADNQCADPPPAIAGTVAPTDPLNVFNGESSAGTWMLFVSDYGAGDTGTLVHWCVEVQ